jgi:pimeloyl-ACP methyl ester carboxylesterase
MDDVRAVMDAVGSERAALLGFWEGGPMSALFAATHPERVSALILYGMMATYTWSPDHPWAPTADANATATSTVEATWGRGVAVNRLAPSLSGDDAFRQWWARLERNSLSPGNAAHMFRLNTAIDARAILGSIQAPTLVLHRRDDAMVPIEAGRYVASQIPGARFVELPGPDHLAFVAELGRVRQRSPGVPDRRTPTSRSRAGTYDGAVHGRRRLDGTGHRPRRPPVAPAARCLPGAHPPRTGAVTGP